MRLLWSSRARRQLLQAIGDLRELSPASALALTAEVDRLGRLLRQRPRAFPSLPEAEGEVRRVLLRKHQYWLIYEVGEAARQVVVLALWPTRRRPGGWPGPET